MSVYRYRFMYVAVLLGLVFCSASYAFLTEISHPTRTVYKDRFTATDLSTASLVASALGKPTAAVPCSQLGMQTQATCNVWQKKDGFVITVKP